MEKLRNVTLEISAKALHSTDPEALESAARTAMRQWRSLADVAERLSILLWIADGSELLEWSGDMADTFEWACWCGCANPLPAPQDATPRRRRNTHYFPARMFPEAECAPRPYSWLRDVVAAVRAAARAELAREVRVGTILDAGPEFNVSAFKFRNHPEVMRGGALYPRSFLACDAMLRGDSRRYAAFPDGIPDGLSFGAFLGAQYREFSREFGFDYLWLSNGLGFGSEPWGPVGALVDGKRFLPEQVPEASERMLGFWRDFFAACPDADVETRGSNWSAGVEMASDAAPLAALYADGLIAPPVNSPWAALNANTGLELAAWMSHVAELPAGRGFPFRFYAHDPWFLNSPWLDRYGRLPWDIFAPLSVSRLREDASVQTPDSVAILSVDDTRGTMPEEVPREVCPAILSALDAAPDRPGPLVWVYPFDEYADAVAGGADALARALGEDLFLGEILQGGLPLNTVASTRVWRALAQKACGGASSLAGVTFAIPASSLTCPGNMAALEAWEVRGAKFLIYGSLAGTPDALLQRLGLGLAEPLEGEVLVRVSDTLPADLFTSGAIARRLVVIPSLDCGGVAEASADDTDAEILAWAETPSGERRVLASRRGAFAFVRAAMPVASHDAASPGGIVHATANEVFPVERLARHVLATLSRWSLQMEAPCAATLPPHVNLSRHDGAFLFHVFAPDTTVALRVRTPYGAPLLTERESLLADGAAIWHPDKSWRVECRLFAEGQAAGTVSVKTHIAAYPGYRGRLQIMGLENATLRFFPPKPIQAPLCEGDGAKRRGEDAPDQLPELVRSGRDILAEPLAPEWEDTPDGRCAVWRGITGPVFIAW